MQAGPPSSRPKPSSVLDSPRNGRPPEHLGLPETSPPGIRFGSSASGSLRSALARRRNEVQRFRT